jgi:hypothetical protein
MHICDVPLTVVIQTYRTVQLQPIFLDMSLAQDPLPLLHLRLPQTSYSWPDLHYQMLGTSHHMGPICLSLNLNSSIKPLYLYRSWLQNLITWEKAHFPWYGCFSLHVTCNSYLVQISFLQHSNSFDNIAFMVQRPSWTTNGHYRSPQRICFLWYLKNHSCILTYQSWFSTKWNKSSRNPPTLEFKRCHMSIGPAAHRSPKWHLFIRCSVQMFVLTSYSHLWYMTSLQFITLPHIIPKSYNVYSHLLETPHMGYEN